MSAAFDEALSSALASTQPRPQFVIELRTMLLSGGVHHLTALPVQAARRGWVAYGTLAGATVAATAGVVIGWRRRTRRGAA